jgi:enamine deaminase RidA (YjgF/YER057c/UK114 family)
VVQISRFGDEDRVAEFHLTVHPTAYGDMTAQLGWVELAYLEAIDVAGIAPGTALFRRFFCSDLANQSHALAARPFSRPDTIEDPCAVSWVRMPPMPPAKVSLWAYHADDPAGPLHKSRKESTLVWQRDGLAHHWTTGLTGVEADGPHDQTRATFARYDADLRQHGLDWSREVLRTWLFVPNIQQNYAGVVAARRDFFQEHGLTARTHFIASTGIEGAGVDPGALLTLDAYAVRGIHEDQIAFLSAPDHLGPAHLYGVTFERGVAITYRDRRHIVISGTASIDPQGQIVHPGDVSRQLDRTLDNIAALLGAAGATPADLGVLIAYVRDPADQSLVAQQIRARCGPVPLVLVVGSVCRPGWLVELEGMAVVPACEPVFPAF